MTEPTVQVVSTFFYKDTEVKIRRRVVPKSGKLDYGYTADAGVAGFGHSTTKAAADAAKRALDSL